MNDLINQIINDNRSKFLLEHLGDELYAVGGSVRDAILGTPAKDIDYSTNLEPNEIIKSLEPVVYRIIPTGLSHQTVTVLIHENSEQVEITSFRSKNMNPLGGVSLGQSIEEDISYRDFTCNALALQISNGRLVDKFNGLNDIEKKIIRAVGSPKERFLEDPLRILRMIRIASQLSFTIDDQTYQEALNLSYSLRHVAIERIRDEFSKVLLSDNVFYGFEKLRLIGFFNEYLPTFQECYGFEQNKFHSKDVYYHTIDVIELCEKDLILRLAALMHDIGKPKSLTVGDDKERHFYLHEKIGADLVPEILKNLSYSNTIIKAVQMLTYTHMRPISAGAGGLRRILRDTEPYYREWRALKEADTIAVLGKTQEVKLDFIDFDDRIHKIINSPTGSIYKNLAINGNTLISLGIKKGPIYKEILAFCQELVIDNPELNTESDLINAVKAQFLAKNVQL